MRARRATINIETAKKENIWSSKNHYEFYECLPVPLPYSPTSHKRIETRASSRYLIYIHEAKNYCANNRLRFAFLNNVGTDIFRTDIFAYPFSYVQIAP